MDRQKAIKKLGIELPPEFSSNPDQGVLELCQQGEIEPDRLDLYFKMVDPSPTIRLGQLYDSGKDFAKTYGLALFKRFQSAFL